MNWAACLERGIQLSAQGYFHAALEVLNDLADQPCEEQESLGRLFDEMGKIYVQLARYRDAVACLTKAVSCVEALDTLVLYNSHLAIAQRRSSEYDKSQRTLSNLEKFEDELSSRTRGILFANLATIEGINGFYEQSITHIMRSLAAFEETGVSGYQTGLYNNLAMLHIETGRYEEAERYLKQALELNGVLLQLIAELGRIYMLRGQLEDSVSCAQQALHLVWSSVINYEKEEIARLCHLLANISIRLDERETAFRLIEKSQLFFGQLGMWREWGQVESLMSQWMEETVSGDINQDAETISFDQISQFLNLLDAMNSQELIDKRMSILLDVRVHYAKILAKTMQLSTEEQELLVYSCRFADYGLTALEPEVALNPTRSEQAWNQYKEHPSLSVRMAKTLFIPDRVIDIIADHHEHFDGTGYPIGKKENEISPLVKIFAVADFYATNVTLYDKPHSEVMKEMMEESGVSLHPDIVVAFQSLFHR